MGFSGISFIGISLCQAEGPKTRCARARPLPAAAVAVSACRLALLVVYPFRTQWFYLLTHVLTLWLVLDPLHSLNSCSWCHVGFCLKIRPCRRMLTEFLSKNWELKGKRHVLFAIVSSNLCFASMYGCYSQNNWLTPLISVLSIVFTFLYRQNISARPSHELILSIADKLRCKSGTSAFARTNSQLYCLLNAYLYQYHIRTNDHSALLCSWVPRLRRANVQATLDNDKRVTALHLASKNRHLLIVEVLIQSSADINARTSKGVILLHKAVAGGHEHITSVLLERSADYPHVASHFGFIDIIQLLLNKGIGIQVKDGNLQTPLHCAMKFDKKNEIWYRNITTVNFLLKNPLHPTY